MSLIAVKTLKMFIEKFFLNIDQSFTFFRGLLVERSTERIPALSNVAQIILVSGFNFYLLVLKFECHELS